jgi:hypothetical protein
VSCARNVNAGAAHALFLARRYDQAVAECEKSLEVNANFILAIPVMGMCRVQQSRMTAAIEIGERTVSISARAPFYLGVLGHYYARNGATDKVLDILEEHASLAGTRYVPPHCQEPWRGDYRRQSCGDGLAGKPDLAFPSCDDQRQATDFGHVARLPGNWRWISYRQTERSEGQACGPTRVLARCDSMSEPDSAGTLAGEDGLLRKKKMPAIRPTTAPIPTPMACARISFPVA